MFSLVIPIYKNEGNIPNLLDAIEGIAREVDDDFETVFVVDGSPDDSYAVLRDRLPAAPFRAQLLGLSRNFGAFAAIRAGLEAADGDTFAVMAADLQEPPGLVVEMYRSLADGECDVAVGQRAKRDDPWTSKLASRVFWSMYRRMVINEIPRGGVDIFGCNQLVRDQLLRLRESNSSLVGLLFWIGFRRKFFPYERARREIGVSAWTLAKKLRYMNDSIFSFSSLPIEFLIRVGLLGFSLSTILAVLVFFSAVTGQIEVPGYAATMMTIIFFGMLNLLCMGVLGIYIWRTFENTKGRPIHIVLRTERFPEGRERALSESV